MEWYQWLTMLGVPTLASVIIGLIIKRPIEKKMDRAEKEAEEARIRDEAIAQGVQALLRDRLLQGYQHYIAKGWADYDDRSNLENIWSKYHALGQNGAMNDMRKLFRKLPYKEGGPEVQISEEGEEE